MIINTPIRFLALVVMVLTAYAPAYRSCGFIWDDDSYIEDNVTLRSAAGLREIWCRPSATPQYYPLVFSTFWLEYHVWGLWPAGYHFNNVLLHGLNAGLLWLLLRRLNVPGAWVAAAIFALHPVHVESVAWVTERKNVLSGFFCLLSFLAFLRLAPPESPAGTQPRWRWYAVSLVLFVAALLSKTITCALPAVLVLVYWWKREEGEKGMMGEREGGRKGEGEKACAVNSAPLPRSPIFLSSPSPVIPSPVLPSSPSPVLPSSPSPLLLFFALIPMFVIGLWLARQTSYLETHFVGAEGEDWDFSPPERCLIAGRALCFYAGKLFWPYPLIFNYPRWHIDAAQTWQYLYPAAVGVVFVVLALLSSSRRLGRAPLTACLIFAGTLLPALGFFNVFPMIYSFVADHFQYLPSTALIALAVATVAHLGARRHRIPVQAVSCLAGALLLVLGWLTWKQCGDYKDVETLWDETLKKNPESWLATSNMGPICLKKAAKFGANPNSLEFRVAVDQALRYLDRGIVLNPRGTKSYSQRAVALMSLGRRSEAQSQAEEAERIEDRLPLPKRDAANYDCLATLYQQLNNNEQALLCLRKAMEIVEAKGAWFRATRLGTDPRRKLGYGVVQFEAGELLTKLGRRQEARPYFDMALTTFGHGIADLQAMGLEAGAKGAEAHFHAAVVLLKLGQYREAVPHLERAVQLQPDNLGYQEKLSRAREAKP